MRPGAWCRSGAISGPDGWTGSESMLKHSGELTGVGVITAVLQDGSGKGAGLSPTGFAAGLTLCS